MGTDLRTLVLIFFRAILLILSFIVFRYLSSLCVCLVWQREVLFSFKSGRMLRSGQILFDYFFGELFLIQNFSPKIARAWRPAVFSLSVYFLFSRSSFSLFIFLLFLFSMEETFRKGILVPSFSVVFCRFDKDDPFWTWWFSCVCFLLSWLKWLIDWIFFICFLYY